jgi:hypothetical protein
MKKLTILFIFLCLITLKADIIPPSGGSGSGGGGDMYKSVYDTNNNGIVDNSEKITGLTFPSISGNSGKFLKTDGTGLLWDTPSGGATTFLQLTDTPSSYSGQAGKIVKVKSDETGLEFGTISGGGGSGTPGGNNKTIQYNNNGSFAGDDNLIWDSGLQQLSITSPNSAIKITPSLTIYDFRNRTGSDEAIDYDLEAFKFVPNISVSRFSIIVKFKNTSYWDFSVNLRLYSDNNGYPNSQLASSLNYRKIPYQSDYAEYVFYFDYPITQNTAYWIVVQKPQYSNLYWDSADASTTEYAEYYYGTWLLKNYGVWYKFASGSTDIFDSSSPTSRFTIYSDFPTFNFYTPYAGQGQFVTFRSGFGDFLNNTFYFSGFENKICRKSNNFGYPFSSQLKVVDEANPGNPTTILLTSTNVVYITNADQIGADGSINEGSSYFIKIIPDDYISYSISGQEKWKLKWDGSFLAGAGKFSVDSAGNITKINNVSYSFPSSQGASGSVLTNNGSGTLSWTKPVGGSGKSAISTISVGSSPFTYQQTSYNLASVIVSGGNVTSIEVSRDNTNWYNVGLTQGQFTLNKNDYIRITYTTAPNMYLMEH